MFGFHKIKRAAVYIGTAVCLLFLSAACSHNTSSIAEKYKGEGHGNNNATVRIGYFGRLEEIPLFVAFEKGFFINSGINPELIKIRDEDLLVKFNSGELDAVTADYRFFNYIETGLPVRLTAGLNAGCIRILAKKDSHIEKIENLKGTRIGIEATGDGTMVLAAMLLRSSGIDPKEDVRFVQLGENDPIEALEKGDIDAACIWEPGQKNGSLFLDKYTAVYTKADNTGENTGGSHHHGSGIHFTRTFTGLSSGLIEKYPQKAVYITKAWLEGAVWTSENNSEALKLAYEKGYTEGSFDAGLDLLSSYMWTNGVSGAKANIKYFIKEQKSAGVLGNQIDEAKFYKKVFAGIMPELY